MARIDAHQHFWQYDPIRDSWITDDMAVLRRDYLPEHLEPLLKQQGFDGCVVVQSAEDDNIFQLQNAEGYPFIKGIVGWVDLVGPELEKELEYYSQFKKMKGFRHILQGEEDRAFMLRDDFKNGVSKLQPYGFTYDILIYADQLKYTTEFVKGLPNQPFVLDHIAKPNIKANQLQDWAKDLKELARNENVYCKLSGMVTEADWQQWKYDDFMPYLDVVVEAFGVQRIMYGSDWPVCLLGGSYASVLEIIQRYFHTLSAAEQEAIFGGNAVRFYNLT